MKTLITSVPICFTLGLLVSACESSGGGGDGGNNGSIGTSSNWTNKEMQTLVANRCANAGCHDGTSSPLYKGISEAAMKSDSNALPQVNAGLMPKGGTPLTAAELAIFRNFYGK